MPLQIYFDSDVNADVLAGRRIAVIGYGNQGHAHAQNLRDSGHEIRVGLREGSASRAQAEADGLCVMRPDTAAAWADIVAIILPDEEQAAAYTSYVHDHLSAGKALLFCHGFSIHFGRITPPEDVDVLMVAPKGPGLAVRSAYVAGHGLPCLFAVDQDASGQARELALAYAQGIGGTRAGVLETSFKEETECDLFGEQAVLCGGLSHLVQAAFDTLVDAGYSPEMAYFECLHEVKLTADLMHEKGIAGMRKSISNTAEFGDATAGPRLVSDDLRAAMRAVLEDIQAGRFADAWTHEHAGGDKHLEMTRAAQANALIESVGHEIRTSFRLKQGESKTS